jgi:hypothetical protein
MTDILRRSPITNQERSSTTATSRCLNTEAVVPPKDKRSDSGFVDRGSDRDHLRRRVVPAGLRSPGRYPAAPGDQVASVHRRVSKAEFIRRSRLRHGDTYDYSLVDRKSNTHAVGER